MNIRVHKKVNGNHITLGKESLVNTFYGLVQLYNKQDTYKDLEITKQDLWELAGYQGKYDSNYIKELIRELTQSKPFDISSLNKVGISGISGSMFVVTTYEDGRLLLEVPKAYQRLLFYKKDIDLMTKAKKKLRMSTEELDHWDNETKEKSKFLVLLKKADLLQIQGKYNKRLYALLMQWSYTGSYEVSYQKFKEILEIPKSYQSTNIDKRILESAKEELLKVGIKITRIIKKKEGRSITGININFKLEDGEEKELKTTKPIKIKDSKSREKNKQTIKNLKDKFKKPENIEMKLSEEQIQKAIKKCMEVDGITEGFLLGMRNKSENIFLRTIEKYL